MEQDAVEEYLRAAAFNGPEPEAVPALKEAYERSGMRGFWLKELEFVKEQSRRSYVPPLWFAQLYARIGEKDQAFEWLQRDYEEHSPHLIDLKVYPMFDSLRSDPRFTDLLQRVGFPQ